MRLRARYYFIISPVCAFLFLAWMIASAAPSTDTVVRLKYKGRSVSCLIPLGISPEEIEVLNNVMPIEFAMGGKLHCLNYGMIRVYVVEHWDNHLQYMEVVLFEYIIRGQESKFWVHLWRPELGFMLIRPITYEKWKEIVFYFTWGEGSK